MHRQSGTAETGMPDGFSLPQFAADVAKGLSATPKSIPCKYLYDEEGSRLFKQIMTLQAYYLTRCELEIMESHKADIAALLGAGAFNLVELGAGDGAKTKVLLACLLEKGLELHYIPIDISESALRGLTEDMASRFRELTLQGLAADYFDGLRQLSRMDHRRNVVLFLGANIGNFDPREAGTFLSRLRESLNGGDLALIGFDLKKEIDTLVRAYNDPEGITARFNMNILHRINSELGGHFDPARFGYYSTYNPRTGAVESFLVSRIQQRVSIEACRQVFFFDQWEPVHTESSYKYREEEINGMLRDRGFEFVASFRDRRRFFIDTLWRVRKPRQRRAIATPAGRYRV
ncbi:MAG: L-histidine N(alpha)-methyltransferase [Thermodesulfobacteriota bacterium]